MLIDMRLVVLLASAIVLIASSANAHVFDPKSSFLHIRIGALQGATLAGQVDALASAKLSGAVGAEVIDAKGTSVGNPAHQGFVNLWEGTVEVGTQFFTGTANIFNLFFTIQGNADEFFSNGTRGSFQGSPLGSSFGGSQGILGDALVDVGAPVMVSLNVIGAGGVEVAGPISIEGAQWITGSVAITNIATNIISITNAPNPAAATGEPGNRAGATGIGFTLVQTVNENNALLSENGVTVVTVAGTTSFKTASGPGTQQVAMVAPTFVNASALTGRQPLPGMAMQILRYVPEPGTMLLLGSAVAGLLVVGRKRMKR
jgi:hypothetical protein